MQSQNLSSSAARKTAIKFGELFGVAPVFAGEEGEVALLSNASKAIELFGYPTVGVNQMIKWQAEWMKSGGRSLGKPTHFEETKGSF